jgi:hypothetical protein
MAHFQAHAAMVENAEALAAVHADSEAPPGITRWLYGLSLLQGVPLNYLVPDATMLPMESIRFFAVDPNWINALIEGALSIGRASKTDLRHDAALVATVYAAVGVPATVTGFLLRSAVVDGWPGLEVTAYGPDGKAFEKPLRMERIAPSLLLFMVAGTIDRIDVHEPAEGLHFGLDTTEGVAHGETEASLISPTKTLRYVAPKDSKATPGAQIDNVTAPVTFRGDNVVNIKATATAFAKALVDAHALDDVEKFTGAEFALQMVEGVQTVTFAQQKNPPVKS